MSGTGLITEQKCENMEMPFQFLSLLLLYVPGESIKKAGSGHSIFDFADIICP